MVKSTRSNFKTTISKAILNGLADDGGLFVFDTIPKIDINSLYHLTYNDVAKQVFTLLLDDFSSDAIIYIVDSTYNHTYFQPETVTMTHLNHHSYLNLYHGETLAFKDMALSILPKLIKEAKRINQIDKPSIVLTATSGDTGSAALSGFSKNKEDYVIVLYPAQGVSQFQEKQMHKLSNEHCHVYAVDGNFDDCQNIVKKLFQSTKLKHTILASANSINIGRLIPQITYYVYMYIRLVQDKIISKNEKIDVIVPTGNFGNIYAAYVAKQMGIPLDTLTIASNSNNVLHELIQTGQYNINRSLLKTISPSMDIIISSNLERYVYTLLDGNPNKLNDFMSQLKATKMQELTQIKTQTIFKSGMASEEATLKTIREVFRDNHILIDPHTAVAAHVYDKDQHNNHTVIVSTASPYKFIDAMEEALEIKSNDNLLNRLKHLSTFGRLDLPKKVSEIATYNIDYKTVLALNETYQYIKQKVGEIDEN